MKGGGPESNNFIPGLSAGADLSGAQFIFVKYDTDPNKVVKCGAGETPCGVLWNLPELGDTATVHSLDGSFGPLAVDGSTILVNSVLKSDSNGKGTVTTTDNDLVAARAQEASSAAREIIVQYIPAHRY